MAMAFSNILAALSYVGFTLARIPFWAIYFLHPALRQHPRWAWRQAIRVRLFRAFVYLVGLIRLAPPMSLEPGKEGDRFVVMDPDKGSSGEDVYGDVMRCDEQIQPERIGATWYPVRPANSEDIKEVVLHFHGGGYCLGDGRIFDCGFAASQILEHTPATHVLCPQYRLSSKSGQRFPAAFQDIVTSYLYIVRTLDIPPERIILSGDSAGGHMVMQLLRYMTKFGTMKAPKAAWLWGTWCDPKSAVSNPYIVYRLPQYATDFIPSHHLVQWIADAYPPNPATGVTLDDPYLTPLGRPFVLSCKTFVQVGEVELNFGEITNWVREMQSVEENRGKMELRIDEYAPHDILKCGGLMGFEAEAGRSVAAAARFTWGG